jgi:predicted nucleotidyltransferase
MDKKKVFSKVKSNVQQVDKEAEIILFGSRARGDNRSDSDWDFLILTKLPETRNTISKFKDKIFDAELELEQPISAIVHNEDKWKDFEVSPLYQFIQKEGIRV